MENIDVLDKFSEGNQDREIIKIKCHECGSLNDEDAISCKGCGREL